MNNMQGMMSVCTMITVKDLLFFSLMASSPSRSPFSHELYRYLQPSTR